MAGVELSFTALPEHVRTARLVASAVARRAGMDDEAVEGVRLAVGEACARAVGRARAAGGGEPVELEIEDLGDALVVQVRDHAPAAPPDHGEQLSLTLVQGLAHRVDVEHVGEGGGSALRLTWRL